MLYFNKRDIFLQKLQEFPLRNAFNDYNGTQYEQAIMFISELFLDIQCKFKPAHSTLYRHITCMTDAVHAQRIFWDTFNTVAAQSLQS